jgi:hypothetical protein
MCKKHHPEPDRDRLYETRQTMYVQRNIVAHLRITVAVEKQYVLHICVCVCVCVCVCMQVFVHVPRCTDMCMHRHTRSLAYPACNSYVPYCDVICGPSVYTTFFNIISYTVLFSEKVIEHKRCVSIFFIILPATSLILKRIQQDIIINENNVFT